MYIEKFSTIKLKKLVGLLFSSSLKTADQLRYLGWQDGQLSARQKSHSSDAVRE